MGGGRANDVSRGVKHLLGQGVYGFPEASRLAGVDSVNTRRWFLGRPDTDSGPVLHSDIPSVGDRHAVSFLDLLDLRVVGQFRRFGITMPTIRAVYRELAGKVGTRHAFAHTDLCVYGKTVLQRMVDEDGVEELREVLTGQQAMPRILEKFLRDIEYSETDGLAARWRISRGVVIDPRRNLGKPISERTGAGTYALARAYHANENDAELVAALFDTSPQAVIEAADFEDSITRGRRAA
jgi:hypothetical protein